MEIINSRWATIKNTDKGIDIHLYKNKPYSYYKDLYEDVKIIIDNGVLTLEGNYHFQKHLWSFDTDKHWIEYLVHLPLPEDEHIIKEGYKNLMDKWKGKKTKYIDNHENYSYHKQPHKIKSNTFSIFYQTSNVLESKEELQTFNKFVETK